MSANEPRERRISPSQFVGVALVNVKSTRIKPGRNRAESAEFDGRGEFAGTADGVETGFATFSASTGSSAASDSVEFSEFAEFAGAANAKDDRSSVPLAPSKPTMKAKRNETKIDKAARGIRTLCGKVRVAGTKGKRGSRRVAGNKRVEIRATGRFRHLNKKEGEASSPVCALFRLFRKNVEMKTTLDNRRQT